MAADAGEPARRPTRTGRAAATAAAALVLAVPLAGAQVSQETLNQCAGCHGPNGHSKVPQTPSLAGQPRTFTENQLVLIREGLRDVPPMKPVMTGMKDETISALAKYYAEQKPPPAADGPLNQASYHAGEELSKKNLCGTCHLADYSGQSQVPRLAGQQEPYLVESMKQFRDNPGPGRDTIMAATLRGMSDADLAHLAHYLANFRK